MNDCVRNSPHGETEGGVDPARGEVREGARDGRVGRHLSHGAQGRVGGGADEGVRDERAQRASELERVAGAQEETRPERTGDLCNVYPGMSTWPARGKGGRREASLAGLRTPRV